MEDINALEARLASLNAQKAQAEQELDALKARNIEKLTKDKVVSAKSFITATSARKQAETTMAVRNHLAKFILEESKEGRTQLTFDVWHLCDAQLNNIVTELHELGYEVDLDTESESLLIKW